jgi:glutathione S-transferase
MNNLQLYYFALSGHCHKVICLASFLGLELTKEPLDLKAKQQQSAAFLALNPLGQIPVLLDENQVFADSHAILLYLALRYDPARRWYPEDIVRQVQIQHFLALSAGEVCQGPALYRGIKALGKPGDVDQAYQRTLSLFSFLNQHLTQRHWLVGDSATIADVAIYSYLALAVKAGFELADFSAVAAWCNRYEALPGFIATPDK